MKENIKDLERRMREKMGGIVCLITYGPCVIFDAFKRSVETSEVLLVLNNNVATHCQ